VWPEGEIRGAIRVRRKKKKSSEYPKKEDFPGNQNPEKKPERKPLPYLEGSPADVEEFLTDNFRGVFFSSGGNVMPSEISSGRGEWGRKCRTGGVSAPEEKKLGVSRGPRKEGVIQAQSFRNGSPGGGMISPPSTDEEVRRGTGVEVRKKGAHLALCIEGGEPSVKVLLRKVE